MAIQSDGWFNTAAVAASAVWSASQLRKFDASSKSKLLLIVSGILLGITLACRIHQVMVWVLFAIWATKSVPSRRALIRVTSVAIATVALVVFPFLIWPSSFGPQHVTTQFDLGPSLPLAVVLAVPIALSLLFMLVRISIIEGVLLWTACALGALILCMGLLQINWTQLVANPVASFPRYPPEFLEGLDTYPIMANSAGVLLIGLLALVSPKTRRLITHSDGDAHASV